MAFDRSRRITDPRQAAEAAFKAATTAKPAPAPEPERKPVQAPPGARESVTLRIDGRVLAHFQKDGPGWQDRLNDALKQLVGV